MQKCQGCGKEIKYIASAKGVSVKCDAEETTFYTESGRKVIGYKIHVCQEVKDAVEKK